MAHFENGILAPCKPTRVVRGIWYDIGSDVPHSEVSKRHGKVCQAWVDLPEEEKWSEDVLERVKREL